MKPDDDICNQMLSVSSPKDSSEERQEDCHDGNQICKKAFEDALTRSRMNEVDYKVANSLASRSGGLQEA